MGNFTKHMSNYWKNYVIAILIILLLGISVIGNFGGGYKSLSLTESSYDMAYQNKAAPRGGIYYNDAGFAPEEEIRKVIKNANLNLETNNYDYSKTQLETSINAHSVLILNQYENKYRDDYRQSSYSFKVPSDKLDIFLSELKNYGEVQNFNVYTNDVTGTYADYSDRLERYNEQIVKYRLMLSKTDLKIEEEIQISQRIDNIEDSIFYLTKQINNIDEDVTYSDVTLSLREEPSVWSEIDFLGFKDGFKMFMESLEAGIQFILYVLGFVLPFAIIYGIYRLFRRFTK